MSDILLSVPHDSSPTSLWSPAMSQLLPPLPFWLGTSELIPMESCPILLYFSERNAIDDGIIKLFYCQNCSKNSKINETKCYWIESSDASREGQADEGVGPRKDSTISD